MALRDTSWVLNTADTAGNRTSIEANSVLTHYEKVPSQVIFSTSGASVTRSRTIVTREWLAVSIAAAQAVVDCKANPTSETANGYFTMEITNQIIGAAKVVKTVDSKSAYS